MEASEALRDMLAQPEPVKVAQPVKLWEAADDLSDIIARILENDGELTEALEAELDAASGTFLQKAEKVAFKIEELEVSADAASNAKDRMAQNEVRFTRAAKRLKDYLQSQMARTGQEKIRTPRKHIWIQNNGAPSIRWEGDTFEAIPDAFRKTRVVHSLDVDAVKDAIRDGQPLPEGVVVTKGQHIRIS